MFSWKDTKNPAAGGAEVMTWEILKHLSRIDHAVTIFTSRYNLSTPSHETIDGVEVYRAGGRYGVYLWAIYYYFRSFKGRFDLVIDQVNTVPFFTPLFVKERRIAFFPQLARQLWFYETRFPINFLGFLAEPFFLLFYRNEKILTISPSSKKDLARFGLKNTRLVSVVSYIKSLEDPGEKEKGLNLAFVGRLVPGKRPLDVVRAFAQVKKLIPESRLFMVGRGTLDYQKRVRDLVSALGIGESVEFYLEASEEKKLEILRRAHLLLVTSVKEGWGLVVTEANSQGTPAVVYDVDGLRDSVRDKITGLVCIKNTPQDLARLVLDLYHHPDVYERLCRAACQDSRKYNIQTTLETFDKVLNEVLIEP